jgi:MFS family permease
MYGGGFEDAVRLTENLVESDHESTPSVASSNAPPWGEGPDVPASSFDSVRQRSEADEWWLVPGGKPSRLLPQWWLSFQQCALTFQPAQTLVVSTLLPLQIAGMSPSQKGAKLGVANAVGAVAQMMQPVFGTASDRSTSRFGRRRFHVWWSSWLMVVGTLMMAVPGSMASGRAFTILVVGYGIFQVSTVWYVAPSAALIVDLVAPVQYGMANGWGGLWSSLSGFASSGLALVVGMQLISVIGAYFGCAAFDLLVMVATIVSFSHLPGWHPEPPPPPPERTAEENPLPSNSNRPTSFVLSEWTTWVWAELRAFAQPLQHGPYRYLFLFTIVNSVGTAFQNNFFLFYLQDMSEYLGMEYTFFGHRFAERCATPDCSEAATAQAVFGMVGSAVGAITPLLGGLLTDRLGPARRLPTIVASQVFAATSLVAFALSADFGVVLVFSVAAMLVGGVARPAMGALQLDCLPSQADNARDLNLLTIPGDITQSIMSIVLGAMIDTFRDDPTPVRVQRTYACIWLGSATATLLAIPLLLRTRASQ